MKTVILITILLLNNFLLAQKKYFGANATIAYIFYSNKNSDLLSNAYKKTGSVGSTKSYGINYTTTFKNNLLLSSGISITSQSINIGNRKGFSFHSISQPFYFTFNNDTVFLSKVKVNNNYISIPFQISKVRRKNKKSFSTIGIGITQHFFVKNKTDLTLFPTQATASSSNLATIKAKYKNASRKYLLSIEPILSKHKEIFPSYFLKLEIRPISYYTIGLLKNTTTSSIAFGLNLSLQKQL